MHHRSIAQAVALVFFIGIGANAWAADKSAAIDANRPFPVQAEQVRADLQTGDKYSEISQEDKAKVLAALDRMGAVMAASPNPTDLPETQKVAVFNDQQLVNTILTRAREDSRMVCRRERSVGSNLAQSQCETVAERRRRTDRNQKGFSRMQSQPGKANN